uniref:Pre-mRNA 3'-end-processing factor FIP1 n=1 Tax=Romanomermis culicivorax TaxID=13658 RepID=A0A915HUG9_ROMCU
MFRLMNHHFLSRHCRRMLQGFKLRMFRPQGTGAQRGAVVGGTGAAKQGQKLDLDATAEVNGSSIYDLDISLLEKRPWRKPGADLTNYFNYEQKARLDQQQKQLEQVLAGFTAQLPPLAAPTAVQPPVKLPTAYHIPKLAAQPTSRQVAQPAVSKVTPTVQVAPRDP